MPVRSFALVAGIIFAIVGVLGFFPGLRTYPLATTHHLSVDSGAGYLFGLFPVNVLHNLVHLLIGIWGILASGRFDASRAFSRSIAVIYAVLTVFGFIPGLNNLFGLVPLWGNDIWLHALTAIVAAAFGWAPVTETYPRTSTSTRDIGNL